ncbi:MAG: hypothetical protein MZW92_38505 [Comamonadaceae bacterium]|nr:hypothetical protein [Comamonadaceae bacterium]
MVLQFGDQVPSTARAHLLLPDRLKRGSRRFAADVGSAPAALDPTYDRATAWSGGRPDEVLGVPYSMP